MCVCGVSVGEHACGVPTYRYCIRIRVDVCISLALVGLDERFSSLVSIQ